MTQREVRHRYRVQGREVNCEMTFDWRRGENAPPAKGGSFFWPEVPFPHNPPGENFYDNIKSTKPNLLSTPDMLLSLT